MSGKVCTIGESIKYPGQNREYPASRLFMFSLSQIQTAADSDKQRTERHSSRASHYAWIPWSFVPCYSIAGVCFITMHVSVITTSHFSRFQNIETERMLLSCSLSPGTCAFAMLLSGSAFTVATSVSCLMLPSHGLIFPPVLSQNHVEASHARFSPHLHRYQHCKRAPKFANVRQNGKKMSLL